MANGILLPPGLRGYVAAEQMAQQRAANQLNQVTGVLALQQAMRQQAFEEQSQPIRLDILRAQLASANAPARGSVVPAGGAYVDASGKPLFRADTKAPPASDLGKLIAERDALPDGDMRRIPYDAKIKLLTTREPATQGKAPSGYRYNAAGDLEAIPGGPADLKSQGVFNQDTALLGNATAGLDRLAVAANELLRHPGVGRITGMAGSLPNVPGMAGSDAAAKLQTLKAQVGFGVLTEMRNASKTGGALGNVTEKELGFLQNALAALDTAQSEDQFKESLQKIIDYSAGAKARLGQAFNMKHGSKGKQDDDPLGLRGKK